MPIINGYMWEITTSTGTKYRMPSEGPNVEEGLSEFRRIHGHQIIIFKIKYHGKFGDIDSWSDEG